MFLFKRHTIYYIEYEEDGIKKRISTKCKIKSEAMKFLMDFKYQLKQKEPTIKSISLKDFEIIYTEFLESTFSDSYLKVYKFTMNSLNDFFGDVPLNSLDLEQFQRYFQSLFKSNVGTTYYEIIKAMVSRAIDWGYYYGNNPVIKITKPKRQQKEVLHITQDEFERILENVSNILYKSIFIFLYNTGLRKNEMVTLKWKQVNLKKRLILLNDTKSKKNRVVPLNQKAFEIINNQKKISEYVFCNSNGFPLNKEFVSAVFKDAVRLTENINQEYHLHNLRSSFASNLANKSIPIQIVSKLLGHSSVKITEKYYTHIQVDSLVSAVNIL
jgi:integrase